MLEEHADFAGPFVGEGVFQTVGDRLVEIEADRDGSLSRQLDSVYFAKKRNVIGHSSPLDPIEQLVEIRPHIDILPIGMFDREARIGVRKGAHATGGIVQHRMQSRIADPPLLDFQQAGDEREIVLGAMFEFGELREPSVR